MSPGKLVRGPALSQALVPFISGTLKCPATGKCLEDRRYSSVRDFLMRDGVLDPKRRLQLAQEMARLFLEYGYNRPSVWKEGVCVVGVVDEAWPAKPYFGETQDAPGDAWQRDLWGKVFSEEGTLHTQGWSALPGLYRERCMDGWKPEGGPILLFMVDTVSHFHRTLIMDLSQGREVYLFLQDPCAEFWEDLDTRDIRRVVRSSASQALNREITRLKSLRSVSILRVPMIRTRCFSSAGAMRLAPTSAYGVSW
jgi:exonuclease V gamma subunit